MSWPSYGTISAQVNFNANGLVFLGKSQLQQGTSRERQIVVSNYGQHDANNSWTYCDMVIHLGCAEKALMTSG